MLHLFIETFHLMSNAQLLVNTQYQEVPTQMSSSTSYNSYKLTKIILELCRKVPVKSNISDLLAYFSTYYLYNLLCLLCTTCCTADKPGMAGLGSAKKLCVMKIIGMYKIRMGT